jgi:transcriptional regulator with XRE-family HTH domain
MGDASAQLRASVEALLEEKGWTQKDLAEKSDLSRAALNRALQGHTSPNLETIERIARALGVEPFELLRPPQEPQLTALQAARAVKLLGAFVERYSGLDHLPAPLLASLSACRSESQFRAITVAIEGVTVGAEEAAARRAKHPVKSRDRA